MQDPVRFAQVKDEAVPPPHISGGCLLPDLVFVMLIRTFGWLAVSLSTVQTKEVLLDV